MRWTARSEVAAPCDDRMRQYLRQMDGNTLVRLDDSVEAVTPLGGDRYEAAITSVGFFGLLACKPVATLRVERTGAGIRYVTEKCQMVLSGSLRRLGTRSARVRANASPPWSASRRRPSTLPARRRTRAQ